MRRREREAREERKEKIRTDLKRGGRGAREGMVGWAAELAWFVTVALGAGGDLAAVYARVST
jgi:hypothetical protein